MPNPVRLFVVVLVAVMWLVMMVAFTIIERAAYLAGRGQRHDRV